MRMSNYDINKNSELVQQMIQNEKRADEEYKRNNPESILILFEKELKELGYEFEVLDQVRGFLPKHKKIIIPIAMKFYSETKLEQDKRYFLGLFHYKGLDECIPLMLEDMYSKNISVSIKSLIAENLRVIHSPKYINDYLRILSMKKLDDARNPIIALVGDFKVEQAIPMLIAALSEEKNITTNALDALGKFKKADLRIYFEEYLKHKNKYYRREAKKALQKLEG
jgi:hypothetical protein